MVDFLIVYEHKNRELDSACLLKAELEIRGYKVKIMQQHDYSKAWFRITNNTKVLITFALRNDQYMYNHVYGFARNVRKVINLQYEQIFSKKALLTGFNTPSGSAKDAVHLCWGKNAHRRLKSEGVKNSFITGALQLDFLSEPFNSSFDLKEKIHKDYDIDTKNVLLYISSFALSSLDSTSIDRLSNETNIDYNLLADVSRISKLKTLEALKDIVVNNNDITVIYRPHPSEYCDSEIIKIRNQYPRFKIIDDLPVRQWIKVSDYIVTWFSTSIIDAYILKKKVVIYRPIKIPYELDCILYDGCKYVSDSEALKKQLFKYEFAEFPISEKIINDYYYINEKEYSYIKIADVFEKVILENTYDLPNDFKWNINFRIILEPMLKAIIIKIKLYDRKITKILPKTCRKWLCFFANYRQKQLNSMSSIDEINTLTRKYKNIISSKE